ncbi:hypothetical protein [Bdellovibrio bacteriovorus]|uniref:hypothetical protein n=1 Tax=Bdellovibrio bacteriovorus TaxID=959 RepID=UPI0035A701B5
MNKISDKNERTVVKIFINILACASLLSYSPGAFAETTTNNNNTNNNGSGNTQNQAPQQPYGFGMGYPPDYKDVRESEACRQLTDKIDEATRKIGEACRKAGLSGGSNCVAKAKNCAGTSGEDSFNTVDAFATVMGLPAGSLANVSAACPQMSGRDYFTEKDKIQKEIKDTEKELADLNDDKAQIQDDYNKEMEEIQKTLTEAQENYKKKELEIGEKERERIAEFNASQTQAKEEMRKKATEILRVRGQLIQSQRDKALKLIAMTEASGKRACMKAVTDAKKSYESVSASTSANHIAQAKKKKQELINIYNDCMDAFDQQRVALNESKRQEQDELTKQINDLQTSMDEVQNSLNLAQNQLEEMKQASAKEKNDALQSVIDLGNRLNQRMQAAYTKMQENLKTLAAKSASLQAALNRANQSLMTLGPAPKNKSSDYAPSDASSEIEAQISIIERADRNAPSSCRSKVSDSKREALDSLKGTK